MTDNRDWRAMSPEEASVIATIVSASGVFGGQRLIDELDGAVVSHSTRWIVDVKPATDRPGADLANGPFPAHAYVPSSADYRGEIIIWIKDGHLDGLEYAWVSHEPPTRWPRPDEMEVVPD
jgi:hypothetical protein